ncbi:MAG: hypothetical protein ACOYUB_00810 [Patescibacteria group bacterium]
MGILNSPEKFAEKAKTSAAPMTSSQAELYYKSYDRLRVANEFFFPRRHHVLIDRIKPIAEATYKVLPKIPARNFEVVNVDRILSSDLTTVVSYAKYEGMNEAKIREIVGNVIGGRFITFWEQKDSGISISDDQKFNAYDRQKQLDIIIDEVNRHGFQTVDNFYEKYPTFHKKIEEAAVVDDLNAIQHEAENDLSYSKEDRFLLDRIRKDLKAKTRYLKTAGASEVAATKEEKSKEYYEAFESALAYLRYCYPEEELSRLTSLAESTLRQIARTRDTLEFTKMFTPSRKLAELFWPIRLGREIHGLEKLGLSPEMVRKYLNRIYDKRLRSESAGYWFETSSKDLPRYTLQPKIALIETIKSTLEAHHSYFSKSDQPVRLMIIINDNTFLKVALKPGATNNDIVQALKNADVDRQPMNALQKYEIKSQSYKPTKKSKEYREFYKQEEHPKVRLLGKSHELPWTHQVDGDYIVRLTTQSRHMTGNKNSPFSLFAVNSHKALIDVDLNSPNRFEFSVKLSHRYSDGKSARPFFRHIYNGLVTKHNAPGEATIPQLGFVDDIPPIAPEKEIFPSLPLFEGNASAEYRDSYAKMKLQKPDLSLSPNVMRAATIALANGVNDMHVLVAAKANPQTSGPYDNVQPVILSLHPIRKVYEEYKRNTDMEFTPSQVEQVVDWIKKYNEAENYAKKGLSTAAVLAAPTGRFEEVISKTSELIHKGTRLLKRSSGMFSPLPDLDLRNEFDNTAFYTASGDTYDLEIDLSKPKKSVGTIGYNQTTVEKTTPKGKDQIFYAVRKTPSQAQAAFRDFIANDLIHGSNREKRIKKTTDLMTKLVRNWEKLTIGQITLKRYVAELEQSYEKLRKDSYCGLDNLELVGIKDGLGLQRQLNLVLRKDAADTIAQQKLDHEKKMLYGFFEAINIQYRPVENVAALPLAV